MAREVVDPTLAQLAAQAGVSYEVAEQAARELFLKEEVKRQLEADAAERRRRPGRRLQMLRDFWIMHEVEWHRAQGMYRETAVGKVAEARKLRDRTVLNIYKAQADRGGAGYQRMVALAGRAAGFPFLVHSHHSHMLRLRELYRCHPGALVEFMQRQLEVLKTNGWERDAEDLQSRIEDMRRQLFWVFLRSKK